MQYTENMKLPIVERTDNFDVLTFHNEAMKIIDEKFAKKALSSLERITKDVVVIGESSHFSTYSYQNLNNDKFYIDSTGEGWVADKTVDTTPAIYFQSKAYGVVIGDSISAGSVTNTGALDGTVDLSRQNVKGQYSFHLSKGLNIPFFNHGIGGQTLAQVKTRWNRDVLAQNDEALIPTRTIPFEIGIPTIVFMHCGVNDIAVGRTIDEIKADFVFFAKSCQDNNIFFVIDNIGGYNSIPPSQEQQNMLLSLNEWLSIEMPKYDAIVVDYYSYTSTAPNAPKVGYTSDNVHPYPKIYMGLAQNVIKSIKNLPVFANTLIIYKQTDTLNPASIDNFKKISINGTEIVVNDYTREILRININKDVSWQQINSNSISFKDFEGNSTVIGCAKLEIELGII